MHVLNVNSALDLEVGSGTAERTFQISRHLAMRGVRCSVLTLDIGLTTDRLKGLEGVEVVGVPCIWRRFLVPRLRGTDLARIEGLVKAADIVHLTGHWGGLNAIAYFYTRRHRKPYLVSPAGLLREAGRSLWLKRIYNLIVGRRLLRDAQGWIAVTAGEFPDFATYGVAPDRVTVLPNGVDPDRLMRARESRADAFFAALSPYILYVGRLHPVKGPDLLLEAFRIVGERYPRHRLLFIGPDDGIREALELRARALACGDRVLFLGYRAGAEKDAAYMHADLLVIPSRSEAMSLVVLEAAAAGRPALLTDRCGFDEITNVDPRLLVPASPDDIGRRICELLEDPSRLARSGIDLREYVLRRFAWTATVDRFLDLCDAVQRAPKAE
jgi:glycosyltransferase involved in cell wall biosynthesis